MNNLVGGFPVSCDDRAVYELLAGRFPAKNVLLSYK